MSDAFTAKLAERKGLTPAQIRTAVRFAQLAKTDDASVEGLIERQLKKLGSAPSRILMATIYLTDLADCEAMNAVWDAWVPPGSAPARACVKVAGLVDPGWRIEIALSAAR